MVVKMFNYTLKVFNPSWLSKWNITEEGQPIDTNQTKLRYNTKAPKNVNTLLKHLLLRILC